MAAVQVTRMVVEDLFAVSNAGRHQQRSSTAAVQSVGAATSLSSPRHAGDGAGPASLPLPSRVAAEPWWALMNDPDCVPRVCCASASSTLTAARC